MLSTDRLGLVSSGFLKSIVSHRFHVAIKFCLLSLKTEGTSQILCCVLCALPKTAWLLSCCLLFIHVTCQVMMSGKVMMSCFFGEYRKSYHRHHFQQYPAVIISGKLIISWTKSHICLKICHSGSQIGSTVTVQIQNQSRIFHSPHLYLHLISDQVLFWQYKAATFCLMHDTEITCWRHLAAVNRGNKDMVKKDAVLLYHYVDQSAL